MTKDEIKQMVNTISEYEKRLSDKYIEIDNLNRDYRNAFERLKSQQQEIDRLKAEFKQLETNAEILARGVRDLNHENYELTEKVKQAKIDVLNELKAKMFEREYMGVKYKERIFYESEIDDMIAEVQNAEDKS